MWPSKPTRNGWPLNRTLSPARSPSSAAERSLRVRLRSIGSSRHTRPPAAAVIAQADVGEAHRAPGKQGNRGIAANHRLEAGHRADLGLDGVAHVLGGNDQRNRHERGNPGRNQCGEEDSQAFETASHEHGCSTYDDPAAADRPAARGPLLTRLCDAFVALRPQFSLGSTRKPASVLARISSTVTFGAVSMSVMPPPRCLSMANTPRSVITRSTTWSPVSGSVQRFSSLGSSLAVCSMITTTFLTPATRSMAPPMPLTIVPGIVHLSSSPFSATCMAPRMERSIWPPRIMAKLSAEEK